MSSNRPETSFPQASSELAVEGSEPSASKPGSSTYVQNIFDLITPTHRVRDTITTNIPPAFLRSEAVDSSLLLGHGASFTVTRQALPLGRTGNLAPTDMGGWTLAKPIVVPERPRYVVYKTAKVSFRPNGDPVSSQDRRALQSVLTEFHALLHPPLLAHPNVLDFLGLAWGSNHAEPLHRLPALIVEYGDRGTLADLQLRGVPLSDKVKSQICLGIAHGLEALHEYGIIHGDVKPENIIMCSGAGEELVPKLADFGFAIIDTNDMSEVMIGGTRTWRAPESFHPVPISKLRLTDVYSFGLLAWSIAIDGSDPFDLLFSRQLVGEDRFAEIDRLKCQNEVLLSTKLDGWILRWHIIRKYRELAPEHNGPLPLDWLLGPRSPFAELLWSKQLILMISQQYKQQEYFKGIEFLLSNTLSKDPNSRDLRAVIKLLEVEKLIRDLEPAVQSFAVRSLLSLEESRSRFALAAFVMNGYGLPSDPEQSLIYLTQAAQQGHWIAQAYLYRMYAACKKDIPSELPVFEYLKQQADNGSRLALQDLKTLNPEEGKLTREKMKYGTGGVGSLWFHEDRWLHGLSQPKLMGYDFVLDGLGLRAITQDIVVNVRGDHLIHAAAALGAYKIVKELLTNIKVDVNRQNAEGETALLCACRSGHPDMVLLLLDSGAKASIQANNGETPLHWLLSFDDSVNPAAVGKDLVGRGGAIVDATTNQRISHSTFPGGTIDVNFQMEGTPLMWAVHDNKPKIVSFLMSINANPNWQFGGVGTSPLHWAAFYHHTECLEIMLNHLERTVDLPTMDNGEKDVRHAAEYGALVRVAIHASDRFSMIIRHGANYLTQLKSTLSLLQGKTKGIHFTLNMEQETLIHYAASQAHDEACEIILASGWRIEELNKPSALYEMTALLESARWNRRPLFHLLLKHGADPGVLSINPYNERERSWSALHHLAEQAHNEELDLVDDIISAGVPVDGDPNNATESPFNIAVRHNAFNLADRFLSHGASINALSTRSSLIVSPHSLTGLGHIIALNARYCFNSLRYILSLLLTLDTTSQDSNLGFIVEASRNLSVLHLCALVPHGLEYAGSAGPLSPEDFDYETNRSIVHELLDWYSDPEHLDLTCQIQGKTALHLAAENGNFGVVEELVKAGANKEVRCEDGERPVDCARRTHSEKPDVLKKLLIWLQ